MAGALDLGDAHIYGPDKGYGASEGDQEGTARGVGRNPGKRRVKDSPRERRFQKEGEANEVKRGRETGGLDGRTSNGCTKVEIPGDMDSVVSAEWQGCGQLGVKVHRELSKWDLRAWTVA